MKDGGGNNGATKICGPLLDGLGTGFVQASFSSKDVVQAPSLKGSEIIFRSDFADDQGAVRFPKAGDGVIPTIEKADRSVVMEQGSIVEQGTHQQLLQAQGAYAAMFKLSQSGVLS